MNAPPGIKLLILDVDGVLTDGTIIMDDHGKESKKFHALDGYSLEIIKRVPIVIPPTDRNKGYLRTKKEKMGHLLDEIKDELDPKTPAKDDKK